MLQAIYLVNRSHHGAVVKCEATNDIGTTQKETTLDVHCKYTREAFRSENDSFLGPPLACLLATI